MKKMIYGFLLWFIALFGVVTVSPVALADETNPDLNWGKAEDDKWWWEWNGSMTGWKAFGIANAKDDQAGDSLLTAATKFINFMLWLLASIALVICLYAGFKMVTSAGDEGKYKEGIEMMKKAGIGLVVIGLAWMIVKVVMWIITNLTA